MSSGIKQNFHVEHAMNNSEQLDYITFIITFISMTNRHRTVEIYAPRGSLSVLPSRAVGLAEIGQDQ